ncbi:hypothetical protein SNEBB_002669 [Seison nebaliae]|nr:hypothetical protein SNEBB_002669 [Seison nebaliae]
MVKGKSTFSQKRPVAQRQKYFNELVDKELALMAPKMKKLELERKGKKMEKDVYDRLPVRAYRNERTINKNPKGKRIEKIVRLRKSLTPGTVLILLAGPYKGKRVVLLKQMESTGLLLTTGPFVVNGCPLRRISQKYVIASSLKIDVSKLKLSEEMTDSFFDRSKKENLQRKGDVFDVKEQKKYEVSDKRKELQKDIDSQILKLIGSDERAYLATKFSIKNKMMPHKMKFE